MKTIATLLLFCVPLLSQDVVNDAKRLSIATDSFCGTVVDSASDDRLSHVRLELKKESWHWKPHVTVTELRVGRTVRSDTTRSNGTFDLRRAKTGVYILRLTRPAKSPTEYWAAVEVVPSKGAKDCKLQIAVNTSDKSVTLLETD